MAKRKVDVYYMVWNHSPREPGLSVWCDAKEEELLEVEGVVCLRRDEGRWEIHTDPRYDANEIGEEIVQLFTVKVPDAFIDAIADEGKEA